MAFVLDASIALGWVVGRQASAYGRRIRLRSRREPYHAPALWRLEVANAMRSLERRRAIAPEASAYDAAYLALALELKMPLACGDGALKAALPRAGVKLA
jgi:predicted nucleic acid-binding protein